MTWKDTQETFSRKKKTAILIIPFLGKKIYKLKMLHAYIGICIEKKSEREEPDRQNGSSNYVFMPFPTTDVGATTLPESRQ